MSARVHPARTPRLEKPFVRTSARATVHQIKQYLAFKLKADAHTEIRSGFGFGFGLGFGLGHRDPARQPENPNPNLSPSPN